MKSTGIIRPVDKMGRVVIPMEIRKRLGIENDEDCFEICLEGNQVILQKHQPTCLFCGELDDTFSFSGYNICRNCIKELYKLQAENE